MKILITGGAGFIGVNLVKKLLEQNHEVWVIDNLNPQIHGTNVLSSYSYQFLNSFINSKYPLKFLKTDVINYNQDRITLWKERFKFDIIYHLAAETGTGQSMYELSKYHNTNIDGTADVLNFYLKHPTLAPDKIILASSRAVYGDANIVNGKIVPSLETDKVSPLSIYAANKLYQEYLFKILLTDKIDYTILRFQNVYGRYQSLNNPYTGILSIFSKQFLFQKDVFIFEDGKMTRDFIHVSDVVDSLILAMQPVANSQTYNVGSGTSTEILNLAELLRNLYSSTSKIKINNEVRKGDIKHNVADITKIKNELNFVPKVSLETGLIDYVNWITSLDLKIDDSYQRSLQELRNVSLLK
jgi:dTDP-L-rhamnose 4-epimerase